MQSSDYHDKKPVIINRSRYEGIPKELRPLGDDIIKIAKEVYHDVFTINWHGSIARGDFVFGESDADFTIFIENEFKEGHQKQRKKLLDKILPKWQAKGITKLDVIAVPKSQLHEDFRKNGLFFCESDGIYLPGYPSLDLSYTIPETTLELITLLNRYFKLWIQDAKDNIPELTKEQIYQQVWKRTYRAVYALAILDGVPYEQNWRLYPKLIKEHAQKYSALMCKLLEKDISLDEIIKIGKEVIHELEEKSIRFKTSWSK